MSLCALEVTQFPRHRTEGKPGAQARAAPCPRPASSEGQADLSSAGLLPVPVLQLLHLSRCSVPSGFAPSSLLTHITRQVHGSHAHGCHRQNLSQTSFIRCRPLGTFLSGGARLHPLGVTQGAAHSLGSQSQDTHLCLGPLCTCLSLGFPSRPHEWARHSATMVLKREGPQLHLWNMPGVTQDCLRAIPKPLPTPVPLYVPDTQER